MTGDTPEYLKTHALAADSLVFHLPDELARLREARPDGGRKAITLLKEHGVSVVLMSMAQDNRIDDHHAPGTVTIQVVEGRVAIESAGIQTVGQAGALVAFSPGVTHNLHALDEAAVLITLAHGS